MIDIYIILGGIGLFIVYQCNLVSLNSLKSINWMNLFRNVWFILPIITMYLEKDSISKIFYKSSNNKTNLRSKLNETKKKVVASSQQWTCRNCNKILDASYEIDHIIPLYKGGSNDLNNLQALCRNCHGHKTINDKLNS
jgi:5-methylcytosine-specific restriction enzyme A